MLLAQALETAIPEDIAKEVRGSSGGQSKWVTARIIDITCSGVGQEVTPIEAAKAIEESIFTIVGGEETKEYKEKWGPQDTRILYLLASLGFAPFTSTWRMWKTRTWEPAFYLEAWHRIIWLEWTVPYAQLYTIHTLRVWWSVMNLTTSPGVGPQRAPPVETDEERVVWTGLPESKASSIHHSVQMQEMQWTKVYILSITNQVAPSLRVCESECGRMYMYGFWFGSQVIWLGLRSLMCKIWRLLFLSRCFVQSCCACFQVLCNFSSGLLMNLWPPL